jgi:hypothetical protein
VDLGLIMRNTISPISLGYSILVGPILWLLHFVFVYALAEFGCRANFTNWWYFPPETIRTSIILVTIPVLLLVAIGGFMAYGSWQRLSARPEIEVEGEYFLAATGILLSSLFLFIILMTAAPSLVLNICDKVL